MFRDYLRVFVFALCYSIILSLQLSAQDAKELNRRGYAEMKAGNLKVAAELLKQAMKLSPNWATPYFNYYQLLKIAKKEAEARKFLEKAYELDPQDSDIRETYVKVLKADLELAQKEKQSAKVFELQKQIVQIEPREVGVAADIIQYKYQNGDFEFVKSFSNKILEANKSELPKYNSEAFGRIFFTLAKVELEDKELKAALEHAEKATRYPMDQIDDARQLYKQIKEQLKAMVDEYIAVGKSLMDKGEYDKALAEFNKALAIDSENETVQKNIETIQYKKQAKEFYKEAMKLVEGKKWLEARDKLEIVLQFSPNDAEAKKHLKKAIEFEEALMKKLGRAERLPRTTTGRLNMAESFLEIGKRFLEGKNYKDARIPLERALALAELDSNLSKIKAQAEEALAKIKAVDHEQQLWDKAREKYRDREYEECLKLLEQLPESYAVDLLSYLAYCHWKIGNKEKAMEYALRQLAQQEENNRAKFVLAHLYLEKGDNTNAFKLAEEIKASDPEYPGIDDLYAKAGAMRYGPLVLPLVILGILVYIISVMYKNMPEYNKNAAISRARTYLSKGMYQDCIKELIEVKKMPNVTAYDGAVISRILAQAYLKTAQYDKAIGECKHLLSINNADQEVHSWLGYAYLGRRMVTPESLPELLNLFKTTERKNVALVSLLGSHYTSQKTLSPEGVEVLEQWYSMEPNNPDLLKSLGKYYLQKGRSDETAMKVFETMLSMEQQDPAFMLGVAKLHLRLGNTENCLKICEAVLTKDVNNELVHPILRDCYRKMGKLDELLEIYRVFLSENPYNIAFQKGLIDCQKLIASLNSQEKASSKTVGVPSESDGKIQNPNENTVICPNCEKPNAKVDYYCQHCGNIIQ